MHPSSMEEMRAFKEQFVKDDDTVLDIGSFSINGSYKELFDNYTGLDIVPGPNVDIVAGDPYKWPIGKESYDVVISGQTFEHIEFPDQTMKEIYRALKPDGVCCIIAPSTGPQHDYPKDYRRYTKASFRKLAKKAGLDVLSSKIYPSEPWNDVVLIAKKGA